MFRNSVRWRTGWDSNPRYAFTHTRVPGVRLKPLGHLSRGNAGKTTAVGRAGYIPRNFGGSTEIYQNFDIGRQFPIYRLSAAGPKGRAGLQPETLVVRFLFRVLSLLALCVGVVFGVIDAIASLSASQVIMTPISEAWIETHPGSLMTLEELVVGRLGDGAWLALRDVVLPQPAFAAMLVLSLAFWMIGYKKPSLAGRFAA